MSITNPLPRYTVKVVGESGQGINSVGEVLAHAIKNAGFYTFGYREYPSLIKGGHGSHQIDFSDQPITAPSQYCNLMIALSRVALYHYLDTLADGGTMLHMLPEVSFSTTQQALITQKNISIIEVPARALTLEAGGQPVMVNVTMVGMVWQMLGLPLAPLEEEIKKSFAKKPQFIESNIQCLTAGFNQTRLPLPSVPLPFNADLTLASNALLSGNHALSLGAITAGVRAYYAYPMTPSSSILSYLAQVYHQSGMVVKQVEDEISVAQMCIGSMFMGTRALTGTSGGGFDLMSETVSLAGMTETPFVCILAQRPGPATGLPTWTMASDLFLAVYAGHGEFARLVISCSDIESCYLVIQQAFNLAEKFQIPVIVLTEKQIAESLFQLQDLPPALPIERHLLSDAQAQQVQPSDRFKITPTGVSQRWLPGQGPATYNGNSDEHLEDGSLTEDAQPCHNMYQKRIQKQQSVLEELPEPIMYGDTTGTTIFVGWGSVKNTILDVIKVWNVKYPQYTVGYLHYEYVWPLKTKTLQNLIAKNKHMVIIEQNAFAQLGTLLTQDTGHIFTQTYLKYDGRPFFVEEFWQYLEQTILQKAL